MAKRVLKTRLCDMLGIEYPILNAGMGKSPGIIGAAGVNLTAAVSNAGGLGVLGATNLEPDELRTKIKEVRKLTNKPFGVDTIAPAPKSLVPTGDTSEGIADKIAKDYPEQVALIGKLRKEFGIPTPDREEETNAFQPSLTQAQLDVILQEKVGIVAFGLGASKELIDQCHHAGAKVICLVGNAKNAVRQAEIGADIIIAQGYEGGGHTGRVGSLVLLPLVVDAVKPLPVLAAGGIADGRGLLAALAFGAVGVWVGTRFEATKESDNTDGQRQNILGMTEEDTIVTRVWSGKTCRGIRHPFAEAWEKSGLPYLKMPLQSLLWWGTMKKIEETGREDLMRTSCGQAVGLIKEIKSAKQVVDDMVEEAVTILKKKFPSELKIA